jgi:signal transduction histidine kinase
LGDKIFFVQEKIFDLDTIRVLHVASWMWPIFLFAMFIFDALMYPTNTFEPVWAFYGVNGIVAIIFLGCSYWQGLQKLLGRFFIPTMVMIIAGMTITANHFVSPMLPLGSMFNFEGITLRLLTALLIGLFITAWQYSMKYVIGFILGTAGLQMLLLLTFPPFETSAVHAALFITVLRSMIFLAVGYFVSQLIQRLKAQNEALAQLNSKLSGHSVTLERLAISHERNRLARELHDTLAHTLSGLTVQLETVKAFWKTKPEKAYTLLENSLDSTRKGLNETRRALKSLRASPLEDLGLLMALREMCENAVERGKLVLELSLPEQDPQLPPDLEQCIYRIAQEAIENAILYANAKKLIVNLTFTAESVLMTIQDDGLGFDIGQVRLSGHFGLPGMYERAHLAGGELTISSQPAKGTTVQLRI